MNSSESLAVVLKNVSFSYETTPILSHVSLGVPSGSFTGIIGPNGGGKTTLIKLLLGFLRPTAGEIMIFNRAPEGCRQRIAYVPQSLHFDKDFPISVLELVLQGRLSHLPWYGVYHASDKQKALEALEKVGLTELRNSPFGALSGGQAQRALIARALASEPDLLLLDEPTAGVDVHAEKEIHRILKSLTKMTIMMVTHHLQSAVELFDEIICVQRTVSIAKPAELCEHFIHGLYHTPLIKL